MLSLIHISTIAAISLQNTVKQRGIDFINCLVDFYNLDANDEKNEVAQKSAEFIDCLLYTSGCGSLRGSGTRAGRPYRAGTVKGACGKGAGKQGRLDQGQKFKKAEMIWQG